MALSSAILYAFCVADRYGFLQLSEKFDGIDFVSFCGPKIVRKGRSEWASVDGRYPLLLDLECLASNTGSEQLGPGGSTPAIPAISSGGHYGIESAEPLFGSSSDRLMSTPSMPLIPATIAIFTRGRERLRHIHGCARLFNAARDTRTEQFLATYKVGTRAEVSPT